MLILSINDNSIIITCKFDVKENQLEKPLHKIFLKSSLNGIYVDEKLEWLIPLYKDDELQIEKILLHFNKYNIHFNNDNSIKKFLDEIKDKKLAFQAILRQGLSAKLISSVKKKDEIRSILDDRFIRKPKDYQLKAINHLINVRNGANFSVPGSGKTTIALAYYYFLKKNNLIDSILIIGPLSSFEPWENEFKECFGRSPKNVRISGKTKKQREYVYLTSKKYEMLLTSYHSVINDVSEIINILKNRKYLVILDESHYIKKPQGGKISESILDISKYATRRVILTGTPMPNSFTDLWSQFTFLWPSSLPLGTVDSFLSTIQNNDQISIKNEIKNAIYPLFYRITKKELQLPIPKFNIIKCDLSPLQKKIYLGISRKFLSEISNSIEDKITLRQYRKAKVIRLIQVASNPALLTQYCEEFLIPPLDSNDVSLTKIIDHYNKYEIPSKFEELSAIVTELVNNGKKVLIWSNFIHNLKSLGKLFAVYNPVIVYGGIPYQTDNDELDREHLINKFKHEQDCLLMIANPAACAESISLHKICNDAIYLDRSFNCAHYLQSLDRIHRLGLNPNDKINYYILIANNSIDEVIHNRLLEKINNMRDIIEGEFPGVFPGYWDENLGDEENLDFDLVDKHLREFIQDDSNS